MGEPGRGGENMREAIYDVNHEKKESMDGLVVWNRRRRMKWYLKWENGRIE